MWGVRQNTFCCTLIAISLRVQTLEKFHSHRLVSLLNNENEKKCSFRIYTKNTYHFIRWGCDATTISRPVFKTEREGDDEDIVTCCVLILVSLYIFFLLAVRESICMSFINYQFSIPLCNENSKKWHWSAQCRKKILLMNFQVQLTNFSCARAALFFLLNETWNKNRHRVYFSLQWTCIQKLT